jgi:hypothetical protein
MHPCNQYGHPAYFIGLTCYNRQIFPNLGEKAGHPVREHEYRRLTQENNSSQVALAQLASRYPNNLPAQISSLIGREHETRELISLCADPDIRLITITGLGGSGKTRLAVEVARSTLPLFAHGCWLVSLGSLSDPDFIPEASCLALKLPHASRTEWKMALLDYLHKKNILLVLDDLEHLLPAAIPFVIEILEHAPSVKILATSKARLKAPGEQVYRLGGLKYPKPKENQALESYGAISLFAEQLRRLGYPLKDTDLPAAVQKRPRWSSLALILAANWGRVMTCGIVRTGRATTLSDYRLSGQRNRIPASYLIILEFAMRRRYPCAGLRVRGWLIDAAEQVAGADIAAGCVAG